MDSKAEQIIKKVKALAERGVGGEKTNAQALLKKLMEKHGVKDEDLEDDKKIWNLVFVPAERRALFYQVAGTVLGKDIYVDNSDDEDSIFIQCTKAEAIEIEAKYTVHWDGFKGEIDVLLAAYIIRNDLVVKDAGYMNPNNLTEAERMRIKRAMEMANTVKKVEVNPTPTFTSFKRLSQ